MPPLVGRDPELATIDRFLRSVPEGFQAVVFQGGAGYGKSALLEETVARAQSLGFCVLSARSTETEAELPFGVLAELLETVETPELELPAPQARALDVALRRIDPDEAQPVDPLGLSLAVVAALRSLTNERPLLVALDDVQWCDPPSLRALGFALRRVDADHIGLVAGLRSGSALEVEVPGSAGRIVHVEVGPLDEPAFEAVVRRGPGARLPKPTIRQLYVACDGNPLFGKEVAALLADRGAPDDSPAPIPVPPSALDAIGGRVAMLAPGTREVLLAAASLPRPTVQTLLAAFTEQAVEAALAEAAAAGIVVVDRDRVRFTHPLVAAAVYGAATPARRRAAHARLARVLTRAEERAPHLALAATRANAAVAAELESAAAAAKARGALDTAGRLLEQAAGVTPNRDTAARRRRGLEAARCHLTAGDTDRARNLLDRLVELSTPGEELAEVLLELALAGGSYSRRGFRYAYDALEQAQQSPALAVRIHGCLTELHICAGDAELAAEHGRAALVAAESLGDEATLATAMAGVVFDDFVGGGPLVLDTLERAVDIERRVGRSTHIAEDRPITVLAHVLRRVGQYERSRELLLEVLHDAVERGDERERTATLGLLSDVETDAGNLLVARDYAGALVELGGQQDDRSVRMYGLLGGGTISALLGDFDEAEALTRAGQELALSPVLEPWLAWGDHTLGLIALDRGKPTAALQHFERVDQRHDATGRVDPAFRRSPAGIEALLGIGRLDAAADRIAEYERRCTPERHARVLALLARYRGLLASLRGEHEDAESELARSLDLQEHAPSPYERARTLMALATARRRHRRRGDARRALEEAVTLFESSGAVVWANRARADIAALGLRRGPADELTPMEERIARAVADGATNREAAASLFLSPRTIEFHLSNVYRKLDLRSRTELAAVLARSEAAPAGDTSTTTAV
jgi:DNA-binding CsgD family transcriptional regulator